MHPVEDDKKVVNTANLFEVKLLKNTKGKNERTYDVAS
jgi:hypothetical protein